MASPAPSAPALERVSATRVRLAGRELVAFAGCDYLGLAHHPEVVAALQSESARSGISAGASPTTTGLHPAHEELERALAQFLGVEAVLLTADGYLSNLVAAQALAPDCPRALVDRESHVSVRDAVRAAGFDCAEYAELAALRTLLARGAPSAIFTDGVFPSQRRRADVAELVTLLDRGARALVVDDCHGLGVHGPGGRGSCAGHAHANLLVTGTLSKALGSFGGFVAGSRAWIETARTRSHAYSGATPIPPALARAAKAALDVLVREPERVARLHAHAAQLRTRLAPLGIAGSAFENPVFALARATPEATAILHATLAAQGLLVPHVRYPDGLGDYLRLALCSEHTPDDVERLAVALERAWR